jgi:hypothetical protein
MHCEERADGNKAKQLAEMRKARSLENKPQQLEMNFSFAQGPAEVETGEEPFFRTHG